MKEFIKKNKLWLIFALSLLVFAIYTLLIKTVDVQVIGPNESEVGFASLNGWFHDLTGEHLTLYKITDYSSFAVTVPIGFIFFITGIVEWVRRKDFFKVDANILALGFFYLFDLFIFIFFQIVKVNYRPCLLEDHGEMVLEASYPSSTSLLAITLLISCIDQINIYVKNKKLNVGLIVLCVILTGFFIIGRAVSGIHWLTDIIGGCILAFTLMSFYMALKNSLLKFQEKKFKE